MGIVNQGEPSNRVALSISLKRPSKQNESLHHPSMCRSRLRWRRHVWYEEDAKTWAEHKAMESCFGENVMKTSLLKMKKAVVKCTGMDMPELELPMYNNPHRFVHALLESSEDLKTMKLFKAVSMMHKGNQQQSQVAPIQLVLGTQQAPQDNMMKKMFMKMMMKKMFHTHEKEDEDESPFGNMGSKKYGMDDDNSQYKLFENLMKSMSRTKRAADDLFELGDRLTEKLQQKTEEMKAKMGNASCVLKELDIIDQNENLDVSGMVQSIENGEWGKFEDEWLQEQHIKDCRTCATFAETIPKSVFAECAYGEKWGKIMMFFQCEKESKYKTCMNHDMKLKLEKSFGSLEDLEEKTGLPEYQLLPMTMKLLNEQMDMFM